MFIPLGWAVLAAGNAAGATDSIAFTYTNATETNFYLRFELVDDATSFFTFEESTNVTSFTTRFTSLRGGSNAWNYAVLHPGGGIDPSFARLGGGTNTWHFSAASQYPQLFWRVRRLPASPGGTYLRFGYNIAGDNLTVRFDPIPDLANYYILEAGTNLTSFAPQAMAYGGGEGTWATMVITTQVPERFWRVRRLAAETALDTDGDGIDDVYELRHGLNPLNPADAATMSGYTDNNGVPLNWLNQYRFYFTNNAVLYNPVSRELSVFNFGQPTANFEAVGRELSVFNFGEPTAAYEAVSREVSTFNTPNDNDGDGLDDAYAFNHGLTAGSANQLSGFTDDFPNDVGKLLTWLELFHLNFGQNRPLYEASSREVSVFNFSQPTAVYEAISREVSVFNVPGLDANRDGIDDAYASNHGLGPEGANQLSGFTDDFPNNLGKPLTWLELYHLNFGQNQNLYGAVSREVSVFNFGQPTANYEAVSREVSVFNIP